jgi:acyl-coenzyme A thioesterase PaaI-like protein
MRGDAAQAPLSAHCAHGFRSAATIAKGKVMSLASKREDLRPAPEGWTMHTLPETFSYLAGPFYFRDGPTPGVGFYAEKHHCNMVGIVHGGALLTLADMALFNICFKAIGRFNGVTLTLNSEFLNAGKPDTFIEATGELTKAGKQMLFARGMVSAAGTPLMSFSGTLRRRD